MPRLALRHWPLSNTAFDRDISPRLHSSYPAARLPVRTPGGLVYSSWPSNRTAGPFRPCLTDIFAPPFYLSFMRLDSSLSSLPYVFVRLLFDLMLSGGTCALKCAQMYGYYAIV